MTAPQDGHLEPLRDHAGTITRGIDGRHASDDESMCTMVSGKSLQQDAAVTETATQPIGDMAASHPETMQADTAASSSSSIYSCDEERRPCSVALSETSTLYDSTVRSPEADVTPRSEHGVRDDDGGIPPDDLTWALAPHAALQALLDQIEALE